MSDFVVIDFKKQDEILPKIESNKTYSFYEQFCCDYQLIFISFNSLVESFEDLIINIDDKFNKKKSHTLSQNSCDSELIC